MRNKAPKLVTRESLQALINKGGPTKIAVIGRALVALLDKQTESEAAGNNTYDANSVGFSGADAYSGSLTAKYYIKHGTLLDWQIAKWAKPARNGFSRLVKYHKQLNDIAEAKALRKAA